jgi:hypothetical protein
MTAQHNDFLRKLGSLRIHIQHLNDLLRTSNLSEIETESQAVEELLLTLTRDHRKLSRTEQSTLHPRFVALRQDALQCLEVSRRILDDSLEALLWLVNAVQDAGNYGSNPRGSAFIVDRKA